MGIMIKPGIGKAAEHELLCYVCAFPVNLIGAENGTLFYWIPAGREDEAAIYQDMELNTYCGTFD